MSKKNYSSSKCSSSKCSSNNVCEKKNKIPINLININEIDVDITSGCVDYGTKRLTIASNDNNLTTINDNLENIINKLCNPISAKNWPIERGPGPTTDLTQSVTIAKNDFLINQIIKGLNNNLSNLNSLCDKIDTIYCTVKQIEDVLIIIKNNTLNGGDSL
jgi:hypothetical protein